MTDQTEREKYIAWYCDHHGVYRSLAERSWDGSSSQALAWQARAALDTAAQQREMLEFGEFIAKGSFNKIACGRGWKDTTMEQRLAAFNASRKASNS